ncbi:hypothetical protein TNCV_1404001 [Trichonephila clavipes]|nr:hypothetical protein TNCV_1404001 [Trichonephila clavipes]
MVTPELHYDCFKNAFQVDACRTVRCFSDFIDSCVKIVHLSPVLMEGVDRGLYDKPTWRKSSWTLVETRVLPCQSWFGRDFQSLALRRVFPLSVDPPVDPPCPGLATGSRSFAIREKGGNRLAPDPGYMVDALKLPNQAPRSSGESLQTCVAWRCPDGTQHLFC